MKNFFRSNKNRIIPTTPSAEEVGFKYDGNSAEERDYAPTILKSGSQNAAIEFLNKKIEDDYKITSLTFKNPLITEGSFVTKNKTTKTRSLMKKIDERAFENLGDLEISGYDFGPNNREDLEKLLRYLSKAKDLKTINLSNNELGFDEAGRIISHLQDKVRRQAIQGKEISKKTIILSGNNLSDESQEDLRKSIINLARGREDALTFNLEFTQEAKKEMAAFSSNNHDSDQSKPKEESIKESSEQVTKNPQPSSIVIQRYPPSAPLPKKPALRNKNPENTGR